MPIARVQVGGKVARFEVPDGTTPEQAQRLAEQHFKDANDSEEEKRIKAGVDLNTRGGNKIATFADKAVHNFTLGADDAVIPALASVPLGLAESVMRGERPDKAIARNYNIEREVRKRTRDRQSDQNPISSGVGSVAGMLASPVGAETGAAKAFSTLAPEAATKLAGSRAGKIASALGNSSIGLGARAGGNNAAIMAATDGDFQGVGDAYLGGAAMGGALGGAIGAGSGLVRAVRDRAPENAGRVAYGKIADMLGRTRRENYAEGGYKPGAQPFTPQALERDMRVQRARGHDPMVADASPEMQTQLAALARKPGLSAANEAKSMAVARTDGASGRFGSEVERAFGANTNGFSAKNDIIAARKAQGAADYAEGGAMDKPLNWTPEMDKFFDTAPPQTDTALKNAYNEMLLRRETPTVSSDGKFTAVPNMRTLDYVKRGFDKEIGAALKAGDNATAQGLSKELGNIKAMVSDANPEYKEILARQRDAFQRQQAVETGQEVLKRLKSDPRELLADMQKLGGNGGPSMFDDLQTGMADALLQMRANGNPVGFMRRVMRTPEQRAVMQHIFGDNKNLAKFERYIRREAKAAQTDNKLLGGSQTMELQQAAAGTEGGAAETVASKVSTGAGFGGWLGAASGALRSYDHLKRGMGADAQNELARILSGDGTGLAKGVEAAKNYATRRDASGKRRSVLAGKIGALLAQGN